MPKISISRVSDGDVSRTMVRPKRIASRSLWAVALLFASACSGAGEDEKDCATVLNPLAEYRFVDADTNEKVCGVESRVSRDGVQITEPGIVDAFGCELLFWSPGSYSVDLSADGYLPLSQVVTVGSGCTQDTFDLALHPDK